MTNKQLPGSKSIFSNFLEIYNKIENNNSPPPIPEKWNSEFIFNTTNLERKLFFVKNKLNDLEKAANNSSVFDDNDAKVDGIIGEIHEKLKEVEMNLAKNINLVENSDFKFSKQSIEAGKIIYDILQQKLSSHMTTFKQFLQKRSEAIKTREKKIEKSKFIAPNDVNMTKNRGALFIRKNENNGKKFPSTNDSENLEVHLNMEDQSLLENDIHTRTKSLNKIQFMLADIGSLFQRLGTMMMHQEIMIDRIDKETDESLKYIEKGKKTLFSVYTDVSSKRKLIIKIFLIILCFAFLYIIFLVQVFPFDYYLFTYISRYFLQINNMRSPFPIQYFPKPTTSQKSFMMIFILIQNKHPSKANKHF